MLTAPPSPGPGAPPGTPPDATPAPVPLPEHDGLPAAQRRWAVLTTSLALGMAVMDNAIANVALPTIAHDVGTTAAGSIWVVNAYQLVIMMLLLPLASLGELYGLKRVYQIGLTVFTLGSLACALSDTLLGLVLARTLQGVGAAGIMCVNTALARFIYPRSMLGRGIGLNATVAAVSAAVGPTIASAILSVASWEWLFAVNVPIGLLASAIAQRTLPATPRAPRRFDATSAVLNALTFGLLIVSIDGVAHDLAPLLVAVGFGGAVVAGFVLVRRQLARQSPLLPVDLLGIPAFRLSVLTSFATFAAQSLALVTLPFFFQRALGRTAVETGLLMTPWPVMLAATAALSGRLSDRYPAGLMVVGGVLVMSAGLVSTALVSAGVSGADLAWRLALCGLGFGLFQAPNNRTMMASAPRQRSGGASGMQATTRVLGQASGAAVAAVIFGRFPGAPMQNALYVAAGLTLTAALISGTRLVVRPPPAAG